jgi:hypothetical protein
VAVLVISTEKKGNLKRKNQTMEPLRTLLLGIDKGVEMLKKKKLRVTTDAVRCVTVLRFVLPLDVIYKYPKPPREH